MTTLKLKPGSTPSATKEAGKPPVRRADPSKRSRTTAPTPKIRPPEAVQPEKTQSRPAAASPARERQARPEAARRGADGAVRERTERKPGSHQPSPARSPRAQTEDQPRQFADRDTPRRGGKFRDGFEQGMFNQDRKTNPKFSPAPVSSQPEQPRLSKRMAELGLCSRREADEFIVNGWVTVDGKVVDILGTRVSPDVEIKISKEAQQHQAEIVTIVLHKPVGYVSGQAEDGYQPAVVLVHPDNQWTEDPSQKVFKRGHLHGLAPAGRLDIDSTGLLVLTQDGRVARQLIGEDSNVEKEYLVRVEGELSEDGMKKLNFGLSLDGVQLKPAKVSWQNEDQLRFVLREGRKRQIRRMCELVGLTVVGLKRVRIGSVTLGKLPVGTWRYLRHGERF